MSFLGPGFIACNKSSKAVDPSISSVGAKFESASAEAESPSESDFTRREKENKGSRGRSTLNSVLASLTGGLKLTLMGKTFFHKPLSTTVIRAIG